VEEAADAVKEDDPRVHGPAGHARWKTPAAGPRNFTRDRRTMTSRFEPK
jgi:hypothetical protein